MPGGEQNLLQTQRSELANMLSQMQTQSNTLRNKACCQQPLLDVAVNMVINTLKHYREPRKTLLLLWWNAKQQ